MKVLYITEGHLKRRDGSSRHIKGFISGLRNAGVEVHSILRKDDNTNSIEVPEINLPFCGTILTQIKTLKTAEKMHLKYKYDLIFGRVEYQTFAAVKLAKKYNIPLVADLNGDLNFQMQNKRFNQKIFLKFTEPNFLRRSKRIIVTAKEIAETVRMRLNIEEDKFEILPMGIGNEFLENTTDRESSRKILNLPLEPFAVLFVGHLNEWQGVEELIRLGNSIDDNNADMTHIVKTHRVISTGYNNIEIWIAGNGPLRNKLEESAKSNRIKFLGEIEPEKLPILYVAADILIQPPRCNLHPGMPTRIAEYLASGKPIIASDRHKVEREFSEKGLMHCVDFSNIENVIGLIREIKIKGITNNQSAREYAKKELHWNIIGEKLKRIFEQILAMSHKLQKFN